MKKDLREDLIAALERGDTEAVTALQKAYSASLAKDRLTELRVNFVCWLFVGIALLVLLVLGVNRG